MADNISKTPTLHLWMKQKLALTSGQKCLLITHRRRQRKWSEAVDPGVLVSRSQSMAAATAAAEHLTCLPVLQLNCSWKKNYTTRSHQVCGTIAARWANWLPDRLVSVRPISERVFFFNSQCSSSQLRTFYFNFPQQANVKKCDKFMTSH